MKKTIFFLTILFLVSCKSNIPSLGSNHRNHIKDQRINESYKFSNTEKDLKKDSEQGLYNMLLKMTVEQRIEFSRQFFYTESEVSCIDSLLKK